MTMEEPISPNGSESPDRSHAAASASARPGPQAPPERQAPSGPRRYIRLAAWCFSWIYLAAVVTAWVIIHFCGDRWWLATLLLLGPRWVFALPLVVLIPAALLLHRPSLYVIGVASVMLIGPVMDFCWHLNLADPDQRSAGSLRIVTCNMHGEEGNLAALAAFVKSAKPDVLAVEEWPYGAPASRRVIPQWNQFTYTEIHLESPYPIDTVDLHLLHSKTSLSGDAVEVQLRLPTGSVPMIALHLDSPHGGISAAVRGDPDGPAVVEASSLRRSRHAAAMGAAARAAGPHIIILGDFNMPLDGVGDAQAFDGLHDAFKSAGFGFGWTYYWRGTAVRIDHILYGANWRCVDCRVGPYVGSPHRPVVATLEPF
jgi:vancomycin resistance protein VanJ